MGDITSVEPIGDGGLGLLRDMLPSWMESDTDVRPRIVASLIARLEASEARAAAAERERDALREALRNPPKHVYWGAGEPDCPRDILAGNGELHTLRCKVCGNEDAGNRICLAALPK